MPATTAVMKLITGRTTAAIKPKKAFVTRIESAPVSGAVIRKDMQEERDAPFLRISATTGTTEQLHSGTGTPTAELTATDFRLSSLSHLRMASREINTWIRPERNNPSNSMGARSRPDIQRKSKKLTSVCCTTQFPPVHWMMQRAAWKAFQKTETIGAVHIARQDDAPTVNFAETEVRLTSGTEAEMILTIRFQVKGYINVQGLYKYSVFHDHSKGRYPLAKNVFSTALTE